MTEVFLQFWHDGTFRKMEPAESSSHLHMIYTCISLYVQPVEQATDVMG